MIGGVDYEDMEWYNYFANVFVAVNPARPLEDAVFGFAITPTGGISGAIGFSVHREERLRPGLSVGDELAADEEVPVYHSWSNIAPGLFVGLVVDSRIYEAIISKYKDK
jgi:hypothetical protein